MLASVGGISALVEDECGGTSVGKRKTGLDVDNASSPYVPEYDGFDGDADADGLVLAVVDTKLVVPSVAVGMRAMVLSFQPHGAGWLVGEES
jgi:hypothetical protein